MRSLQSPRASSGGSREAAVPILPTPPTTSASPSRRPAAPLPQMPNPSSSWIRRPLPTKSCGPSSASPSSRHGWKPNETASDNAGPNGRPFLRPPQSLPSPNPMRSRNTFCCESTRSCYSHWPRDFRCPTTSGSKTITITRKTGFRLQSGRTAARCCRWIIPSGETPDPRPRRVRLLLLCPLPGSRIRPTWTLPTSELLGSRPCSVPCGRPLPWILPTHAMAMAETILAVASGAKRTAWPWAQTSLGNNPTTSFASWWTTLIDFGWPAAKPSNGPPSGTGAWPREDSRNERNASSTTVPTTMATTTTGWSGAIPKTSLIPSEPRSVC
mmetsp:Transcript_19831/g.55271  ORF Transcript_19831/g.55271 Transcript_19831/m.55271 type:complete len:327 (+) Transcript_19831:998-1978(+)